MQVNDSDRLIYRPMTLDDHNLMFELDNDPAVMEFITDGKIPTMEEIQQIAIPRLAKYLNVEKGWGLWNAFLKDSGEYIGWVLVRPMNFFGDEPILDDIELGWRFKQSCWGKGYGTEAAKQVMTALSELPYIKRFTALAVEDNIASIKIMKKLGMIYEKTDLYKDAQFGDLEVVYYSIDNKKNSV